MSLYSNYTLFTSFKNLLCLRISLLLAASFKLLSSQKRALSHAFVVVSILFVGRLRVFLGRFNRYFSPRFSPANTVYKSESTKNRFSRFFKICKFANAKCPRYKKRRISMFSNEKQQTSQIQSFRILYPLTEYEDFCYFNRRQK